MFMQKKIKPPVHNVKRTIFLGYLDISGVILNEDKTKLIGSARK